MSAPAFSPVAPGKSGAGQGPTTNRGQKCPSPVRHEPGALVDFLTVVIRVSRLEECAAWDLHGLLPMIFGARAELMTPGRRGRAWQFYRDSALIFDRNGEQAGMIGLDGNGETVCISLSGTGCRWVENWPAVVRELEILEARITRVDVAFDDYDGRLLDVRALEQMARDGEGFTTGGRPPKSRFLDDHGHGTGSTLYVGGKGHKELCVYEKGKQLGDETSPWTRAEVRLYAKHVEEVPFDVLLRPLEYLRGAYPILARLITGACDRLTTVVHTVEATARAMVRWLKTQVGPSLHLLGEAMGDDFGAYLRQHVHRAKRPGRFARSGADTADLAILVRNELCALT